MKRWLHKKPMRPMQKPMPREMALPSGISNQAMLSMLESQGIQTTPRPASGGTPLDEAMRVKFERQFGLPMGDVRVHHNSDEPAKFGAGAYTYGTDVFIRPGQEKLLNHEMTHVAQQELGQVRPTGIEHGMAVNRSPVLEHSADMGTVPQMAGAATGPVVQCAEGDRTQEEINEILWKMAQPPLPAAEAAEPVAAEAAEPVVTEAAEELAAAAAAVPEEPAAAAAAVPEEPAAAAAAVPVEPAAAAAAVPVEPEEQSMYDRIFKSVTEKGTPPEDLERLRSLKDCFGTVTQQSLEGYNKIRALVEEYPARPTSVESDQVESDQVESDQVPSSTKIVQGICFRVQSREAARAIDGIIRSPIDIFSKIRFVPGLKVVILPVYAFPTESMPKYMYVTGGQAISRGDIRLFPEGKQPKLWTSGYTSLKRDITYKNIVQIIVKNLSGRLDLLRNVFQDIYTYIAGASDASQTVPFKDDSVLGGDKDAINKLTEAINCFAALFFLEAHYTRAYCDGGKNARAALYHVINYPEEFQDIFGVNGRYTLARVQGNSMQDSFVKADRAYNSHLSTTGKETKKFTAFSGDFLPDHCYSDSSSDEFESDKYAKEDECTPTRPRKRRRVMSALDSFFDSTEMQPRVLFYKLDTDATPEKAARATKNTRGQQKSRRGSNRRGSSQRSERKK